MDSLILIFDCFWVFCLILVFSYNDLLNINGLSSNLVTGHLGEGSCNREVAWSWTGNWQTSATNTGILSSLFLLFCAHMCWIINTYTCNSKNGVNSIYTLMILYLTIFYTAMYKICIIINYIIYNCTEKNSNYAIYTSSNNQVSYTAVWVLNAFV